MEITIEPRRRFGFAWRELWTSRELLYFFAWRDLKVRYKEAVIGIGWAVFQPLLATLIFTFFFGRLSEVRPDEIPYPIFIYAGLLFWNYFASVVNNASSSVIYNRAVLTKVYFPRLIAPLGTVLVGLVDFAVAFTVFLGLIIWFDVRPYASGFLFLPAAVLVTTMAAAGLGTFLAAVNAKYRDVKHALPFLIQIMFFLTPVIYPVTLVPERFQWLLYVNPVTGVITSMRSTLLGEGVVELELLCLSVVSSTVLLLLGFLYFTARQHEMVDLL